MALHYTPADVLSWLPHLNRNLLHFWDHSKKLLSPSPPTTGKAKPKEAATERRWRVYSESQLSQLALLNYCYALKLAPEFTEQVLQEPDRLRAHLADPILQPLLQLIDGASHAVRTGDQPAFWQAIVREARLALQAEYCFVWRGHSPNAQHPGAESIGHGPAGQLAAQDWPIASLRPGLLDEWRARYQENARPINLAGSEAHLAFASEPVIHSVLALPLVGAGRGEVGWLIFCNRQFGGAPANPASLFNPVSEGLADLVAAWTVATHMQLQLVELFASSAQFLATRNGLQPLLEQLLRRAVEMTGAAQGRISFHDAKADQLQVVAAVGPDPLSSLSLLAYDKRETVSYRSLPERAALRVTGGSDLPGAIASPLLRPHQDTAPPIGVLSLEFAQPDAFGAPEIATVKLLAQHATVMVQSVNAHDTIQFLFDAESNRRRMQHGHLAPSTLDGVLKDIHQEFGISHGVIFIANYQKGTLVLQASRGARDDKPFEYRMDEAALSTEVFREGVPCFLPRPGNDGRTSARGLDHFGIRGPVVVAPLRMGPLVVGVISLWGDEGAAAPSPASVHDLLPFMDLAFASTYSEDRSRTFSHVAGMLEDIEENKNLEAVYQVLIDGLQQAGFDRSRILRRRKGKDDIYDLVKSGGSDPDWVYDEVRRVGIRNCDHVRFPTAFRYGSKIDPGSAASGVDPNAKLLGKPADLPWANAPIFVGNELFGYLAADNKESRKPIRTVDVEAMSIISLIAGRLIANVLPPAHHPPETEPLL